MVSQEQLKIDHKALRVINQATEPTMLALMVGFTFSSRWRRLRRNPDEAGIVGSPDIPAKLEINGAWMGTMTYDEKLLGAPAKGHLYVGVVASHSNRDFLIRVPPPKKNDGGSEKPDRIMTLVTRGP